MVVLSVGEPSVGSDIRLEFTYTAIRDDATVRRVTRVLGVVRGVSPCGNVHLVDVVVHAVSPQEYVEELRAEVEEAGGWKLEV